MDTIRIGKSFSPKFRKLYSSMDEEILELEGISPRNIDISVNAERYLNEKISDMSIDSNANLQEGRSYGNYILEVVKSQLKLLGYHDIYKCLVSEFDEKLALEAIGSTWKGDLYVHDSTAIQVPYCWAFSAYTLLEGGCKWGQLHSLPAKRRKSFIDQVKEVTIELAQEHAGAIAIGDLFACYSYFVKREGLDLSNPVDRKDIENDFQSLVFTLNKKLRPSHQSPFTNLSIFDKENIEQLFGEMVFPDGSRPDSDLIWEIQKIFCDWFHKGDPTSGVPYRFPVVTLNLKTDENRKILDKKALEYYSKINLKKGCFNIYISSGNKVASCCRLVNDFDLAGCDSFGNGGVSLGSHRIVTINLARLGKRSKDVDDLRENLKHQLNLAKSILLAHRKLIQHRIDDGFLSFFKRGLCSMERMFSTFGISGVYECLLEMESPIHTEAGKGLAHLLLEDIKLYAKDSSKETGFMFNVEQVPSESLAGKFAAKDNILYGMDYPLYSNQFIPLWVDCDIFDRVKLDGEYTKCLTGGGISHLNLGEQLTSSHQMKKLIEFAVESGCEHFAINYNFAKCANAHITISGPSSSCSLCGDKIVEQYTRIIGYFTPVSVWNKSRREEHPGRVFRPTAFKDSDSKSQKIADQMRSETTGRREIRV